MQLLIGRAARGLVRAPVNTRLVLLVKKPAHDLGHRLGKALLKSAAQRGNKLDEVGAFDTKSDRE
jgi:hypothetical protein